MSSNGFKKCAGFSLSLSLVLLHTLVLFMLPDFLSFSPLSQKYFFVEGDFEPPTPETRRSQTRIFLYLLLIRGGINIEIVILCFGGNFLLICIFPECDQEERETLVPWSRRDQCSLFLNASDSCDVREGRMSPIGRGSVAPRNMGPGSGPQIP